MDIQTTVALLGLVAGLAGAVILLEKTLNQGKAKPALVPVPVEKETSRRK
jgi:hypothetical protein